MGDASSVRKIRFGDAEFETDLPRGTLVARIEPAAPSVRAPAEEIIGRALEKPVESTRLREIARGKRSAAILVPGKDRVAAASVFLPLLLDELNAAGIPDERVEVFLATGTHVKHSPEDAALLLGEEAISRVRWRQHNPLDERGLRSLGTTSYGNEIFFNSAVLDADVKVLTGRIIPHYFAGLSGGRKTLLPGVAGFGTICRNHRLTLDDERGIHPRVGPCSLDGNPVHLDMLEAARLVKPVFILNTLLDTNHDVIGAFAGDLEAAHRAGCVEAKKIFKVGVEEQLDAVITSAGGAPYDCNFMQALKALFDVQEIVRPGGAILCIAECSGGMKEGFVRWGRIESDEELERSVRSNYDLTGHNSIMIRQLIRRLGVALWSSLPDEGVRAVGIEPVHSLQEGRDWLLDTFPGDFHYAVVPFANVTHATLA